MSALPSAEREIGHLLATTEDHERRLEALEKRTDRLWQVYMFALGASGVISYLLGVLNSDWARSAVRGVLG